MTVSTHRSSRRTARLAAAVLVTAAAGLGPVAGLGAAPASAAVCDSATGVSVVADFNELGGGVVTDCIGDGAGRTAADLFTAAGLPLTDAQRQPGFVCRVDGKPTSDRDPCINASPSSAYWGLWWSDGDAGSTWTYSSQGARSLTLPAGGLVALSWDETSGDARPSASATRPAPAATPAPTPAPSPPAGSGGSGGSGGSSTSGTTGGSGGSGGGGKGSTSVPSDNASTSSTSSASSGPDEDGTTDADGDAASADEETTGKRSGSERKNKRSSTDEVGQVDDAEEVEETPAPIEGSATTDADPERVGADAGPAEQDALAGWVGPTLIVVLFGGAAAAWWLRRRGTLAP